MTNPKLVEIACLALTLFKVYVESKRVGAAGRRKNLLKPLLLSLVLLFVSVLSLSISLQVLLFIYLMSLSISLINVAMLIVIGNLLNIVFIALWYYYAKKQIAFFKQESRLPILLSELVTLIYSLNPGK